MPETLVQRIVVDTSGIRKGYREAGQETRRFSQGSRQEMGLVQGGVKNVGLAAKRFIGGLFVGALVAVTAAMKTAVSSTAKFRQEMAQVATLTGRGGFSVLQDQVLAIAKTLPVALSDLTSGLYQAVSAGVEAGKAVAFLDVAARAAVGGASTVTQSVQGLTAALNGFNIEADQAENVADTLFVGVKRGVTTFGQLAAQLGSVSGLANEANLTLEETVAATAALTLTTNDTSRAVTQLRGIIQKAIKPTERGVEVLESLGLSFDKATIKEKGFRQALTDVVQGLEKAGVSLGTVFEDVEGLTGALTLTNAQAESFASILGDMATKQGASKAAFLEMKDEAGNLWDTLKNRLNVSLMELGSTVMPTVNRGLERAIELMRSFDSPAENLLNTLKDLPGVDPATIARLERMVQTEQLLDARRSAQSVLDADTSVKVGTERVESGGILGSVRRRLKSELIDIREMSMSELEKTRDQLIAELELMDAEDLSKMSGFDKSFFAEHVNQVEDQIQVTDRVIAARLELDIINKQLAISETALADAANGDGGEATKREAAALTLSQRIEALTAQRDTLVEQGVASAELVRVNRELKALEEEKNRLMSAGVENLDKRRATAAEILALQEKINEAQRFGLQRLQHRGLDPAGLLKITSGTIGGTSNPQVPGLRGANAVGDIAEDAAELDRNLKRGKKNADDLGRALQNVSTAGRSLLRVADILGGMSDEMRSVAQGALDVVDNIGALSSLEAGASLGQKIVPYAGIAAGLASMLVPLFRGDDAVQEIMRENTRRIERAIFDLTEAVRVGSSVTTNDARSLITALSNAETAGGAGISNIGGFRGGLDDVFDLMRSMGLEGADAFDARFDRWFNVLDAARNLGAGDVAEGAEAEIVSLTSQLAQMFSDFLFQGGSFTGSVQGLLTGAQTLSGFGAFTPQEAIAHIVDGLADIDTGVLAAQFAEIAGLDLQTAEGQERLREIIAAVAQMNATGINRGDLSADSVEDVLSALQGLVGGGASTGDAETDIVRQVQQSITTFQAMELTVLAEERNWLLRQIMEGVTMPGKSNPTLNPLGGTNNLTFNLSGGVGEAGIRDLMADIETELRRNLMRP